MAQLWRTIFDRIGIFAVIIAAITFLSLSAHAEQKVTAVGAGEASVSENGLKAQKLASGVFAIVGEMAQRSAKNLGNNATFGLVVTGDGAVLIDPGGSYKGAVQLHQLIKKLTPTPVKFVINTGGQDHRWLGNGYWREQGAKIIASEAAVEDHNERASMQMTMLTQLVGKEGMAGTTPAYADITFAERHSFSLGGQAFELVHAGAAHTPGDSFVRLGNHNIIFSGDIIYLDRLLGVGPQSASKSWIEAFKAIDKLAPAVLVPGHGAPATMDKARRQTLDYLTRLRQQVAAHMDAGKDMTTVGKIDQSSFKNLLQFDSLAGRNALAVFAEMEFE